MASARRNTAVSKNWDTYRTNSQAWDVFLLQHPDAAVLHSRKEFNTWAKNHPQYAVDLSLWDAKEVRDAGYLHHNTQEQTQGQTAASGQHGQRAFQSTFGTAFGLPFLAVKKELMQDDDDYLHLVEEKRNEWRKKNKTKIGTQEEIDYIYGKLNDHGKSALDTEAEDSFRQKHTRNKKKIDRYERNKKKIYSRFDKKTKKEVFRLGDDPAIKQQVKRIIAETDARMALAKKNKENVSREEMQKRVEEKHWQQFAAEYEDKAKAYGTHNSQTGQQIQKGLQQHQQRVATQGTTLVEKVGDQRQTVADRMRGMLNASQEREKAQREAQQQNQVRQQQSQQSSATPRIQFPTQRRQTGPSLPHWADRLSGGKYSRLQESAKKRANQVLNHATRGLSSRLGQRMRPFTRGFGAASNIAGAIQNPRGALENYLQKRALGAAVKALAQKAAQFLGGQALTAAGGFLASFGWMPLIILLIIFLILGIVVLMGCSGYIPGFNPSCSVIKESPTSNSVPGLSIRKTGPAAVENGATIEYSISVTYNGPLNVVIEDTIPANTEYVSSTGTFSKTGNTITWPIKSNKLEPSRGLYLFNFTVKPLSNDIIVTNKAVAKAFNDLSTNPNLSATDFDTLFKGQGQNIGVLGDEDSFTQKILAIGPRYGLTDKEAQIRQIYKTAVAKNVNPLIIVITWGAEVGYKINNNEFSCPPHAGDGFSDQLRCAVNTYSNWMDYFEKNKDKQTGIYSLESKIGKTCIYNDPFIFAAEKYGPICAAEDNNANWRPSLVKFYKEFLGSN